MRISFIDSAPLVEFPAFIARGPAIDKHVAHDARAGTGVTQPAVAFNQISLDNFTSFL
jgi:hypothetical protein